MKNNLELFFISLGKRTNERLNKDQILFELALLFLWKFTDKYNDGSTSISSVISGKISLSNAYSHIDEELFNSSELPKILSSIDSEELLIELDEYSQFDIKEWASLFYNYASKSDFRKFGIFFLQEELVELMYKLSLSEDKDVYIPYSNSFQLAVKASAVSKVTFGTERELPFFKVFAMLAGFEVKQVSPGHLWLEELKFEDSHDLEITEFETVLSVFPFELRAGKSFESIDFIIENRCKKRAVLLVSDGVLFRGGDELKFRKKIVEEGYIDSVIHLPTPSIYNTSIPLSLLVIDKTRESSAPVTFYDADNEELYKNGGRGKPQVLKDWDNIVEDIINKKSSSFSRFVTKEEIKNNNYDLSVRRYVRGAASERIHNLENTKSLSDIAELIRGQLLKEETPPSGEYFFVVGPKDIGENGVLKKPKKKIRLTDKMKDRAVFQKLIPGDILLVSKGSVGKVALVGKDSGDSWVASQSFQIVRLKHNKSINKPEYLFSYLSSPLVQKYWSEQVTGTSIPVLKTTDIKGLPVPVLPNEEQKSIVFNFNNILTEYKRIQEIQQNIENLRNLKWSIS